MKSPLTDLMQQAQKMQKELERMQQEAANAVVTGEAGGGMVRVQMNGRYELQNVDIDPTLMAEDKTILQALLVAAVNDASRRIEIISKERLAGVASGLNLPAGLKLPF
jgi:DNA-binding YbaB/EbfC family protein